MQNNNSMSAFPVGARPTESTVDYLWRGRVLISGIGAAVEQSVADLDRLGEAGFDTSSVEMPVLRVDDPLAMRMPK